LPSDLTASKIALRAPMRARRRRLSLAHPHAAARAADLFPEKRLTVFAVAAGYHPIGSELSCAPLLARLRAAGAAIALPVSLDPAAPLIFRAADGVGGFVSDALGIASPPPSARLLTPDLVIVPVLAFDLTGRRLGQGRGCYDRTLEALRMGGPIFAVGLAYAGQKVERVPAAAHDQGLDAVLTETGYIEF